MELDHQQIVALAPDASSLAAAKKLSSAKHWQLLGTSALALWGECQGSALYQVKIDRTSFAHNCTCPSRKLPCKHVLGLLFIAHESPAAVSESTEPDWVTSWLEKRAATAEKKAAKAAEGPKPVDELAQAKRAKQRDDKVLAGLERLDLWLEDLIRNGLARLESASAGLWETEARRLVDAQASALATRVQQLGELPGSGPHWPRQMLTQMGRLALLSHAYRRSELVDEKLQAEIRQLIGWTVNQEELSAKGELVEDDWLFLAQEVSSESRLRVQRNWLWGKTSARPALILAFSAAGQPFAESFAVGVQCRAELCFYPGTGSERAALSKRLGQLEPVSMPLPGFGTIDAFLQSFAQSLADQPWRERCFGILTAVQLLPPDGEVSDWCLQDQAQAVLPMAPKHRHTLLALSGGATMDVALLWDGALALPLGVCIGNEYRMLT